MRLEAVLQDEGIDLEKHTHANTYTAQRLADIEHVSGYMVAKPVIVRTGASFVMCVVPAPEHLDLRRVATILQDPKVRLASEAEMGSLFPDCELGAEPPIGPIFGIRTIMDRSLLNDDEILMQAGTHHESILVRREDWQRVCKPVVASITTD